jgi:hypothetical protein
MDSNRFLPARFRARDAAWWATRAHWLSLALAFVFIVWVDRHKWFDVDEWNFLVDRGFSPRGDDVGIFAPHNEHWSTIPVLGYRFLFSIFGVRTYFPYLVVVIVFHLLVAHLLWRLLRRIGVDLWLATVAIGLFAVLGIGWENLEFAFQWSLIGPLATGLAALLVMPTEGPLGRRDVLVVALLTAGLMFSGLGLTMVVIAALVVLLRRGLVTAIATAALPVVVYLVWFAAYGRDAAKGPLQKPFTTALQDVPAFVWRGLTGAVDGATGLEGLGAVVIALLVLWLLMRRASPVDEPWPLVLASAAGAVVFLALTTIRRSGLGIDYSASPRYAYVVVALLLPAVVLALDAPLRRSGLRWVALVVGGGALLLVQLSVLTSHANKWGPIEQEQKQRIVASAQLAREGAHIIFGAPVPTFIPNLTIDEIENLDRDGQLPGNVRVAPRVRLTARVFLQSSLGTTAVVTPSDQPPVTDTTGTVQSPLDDPTCAEFTGGGRGTVVVQLSGDAALPIRSSRGGPFEVAFRSGGVTGKPREYDLPTSKRQVLSLSARGVDAELRLPPGTTKICGLAPG